MLRKLLLISALAIFCFVAACDDDGDNVNTPNVDTMPLVLHYGPNNPASFDAFYGRIEDRTLYVQFGDPQGFVDLATATLNIEDIRIVDVIGRDYRGSADMGGSCNGTGAEYDEDLPFDLLEMFPTSLGGITNLVVAHRDGFVDLGEAFCIGDWHGTGFLDTDLLISEAPALGTPTESGCGSSIALFGVYPPLRDPVSDIIITRLELEYINVSVTAFDASGNSVVATWPSLRIYHTHRAEIP